VLTEAGTLFILSQDAHIPLSYLPEMVQVQVCGSGFEN
jgi:hypothetical protein